MKQSVILIAAALLLTLPGSLSDAQTDNEGEIVRCANLVYGQPRKTSRCFGDKFLREVRAETRIKADSQFTSVSLDSDDLFNYPFAVLTGEGEFTLSERERKNLRRFVERGGFILASAGCSSRPWADSFRSEMRIIYPDREMIDVYVDHDLFRTVHEITEIRTASGRIESLKGLKANGRLALIFSEEGLNDTGSVKGCCCCGGNEIRNSMTININIFAYALTH